MPRPTKDFQPSVRYVGETTIFFRDKQTIIIQQGSTKAVFHRWYDRHNFDYKKSWLPFCRAMRERTSISLAECYTLAAKLGVMTQSYSGGLSIPGQVKVIRNRSTK